MTSPDTPTDRMVAALTDPDTVFSRDQLAHILDTVLRWTREDRDGEPDPLSYRAGVLAGYRQRLAEENAAYPPPPFGVSTTAGYDAVQVHRKRMGVDRRYRRRDDHPGGPVP